MESKGTVEKPENDNYVVGCVVCGQPKPVLLYPHRIAGRVVGWVFVCAEDQPYVIGADVSIATTKPHHITLGPNPDA